MALRSRRFSRSSSTKKSSSLPTAIVVSVIAVLIVGAAAAYFHGKSKHIELDRETLCPSPEQTRSITVVVLDVSDALSPAQQLDISNQLQRQLEKVPRLGLIQVYGVRDLQGDVPRPRFTLCNPGTDSDVNALYQNPRMALEKWRSFQTLLKAEVLSEIQQFTTKSSPILETLQALSLYTFGAPELDHVSMRRLIVVSDLMQNSIGLSMYRGIPSFEEFRTTDYYSSVRAHLEHVDVSLLYIVRKPKQQWPVHRVFWESYFKSQGAQIDDLIPIYGIN